MNQIGNAKLDQKQKAKLHTLETELGGRIVTMESTAQPAELSESQLKRLQLVENEVNDILIVYEPKSFQMGDVKLDKIQRAKLRTLEAELGGRIVTIKSLKSTMKFAKLSESQLKRLQEIENEVNDILIVYKSSNVNVH
ncbi:MAG: hypothetical protein O8C63_02990 [Candidatus Methanoperedens sp.]|nr:hypothetical protein [Candidatus Methanoperedens sp.]